MPAANNTLSNCYIPLLSSGRSYSLKTKTNLDSSIPQSSTTSTCSPVSNTTFHAPICPSHRPSGSLSSESRTARSIRHLCIDRHFLSNSTGSAIIELGHTKVICNVQGPRPLSSSSSSISSNAASDGSAIGTGMLHCQIRFAPNFAINLQRNTMGQATPLDKLLSTSSSSAGISAQETELSLKLQDALVPSLPMHLFMKNVVDVFVLVLQDDGAILPACLMAASLALADSGVEVYDLVSSFSIAVVSKDNIVWANDQDENDDDESMNAQGEMEERCGLSKVDDKYHLLADPDANEISKAEGILTIGMMSNWKEVVFWDQTGRLPPMVVSEAVELCKEGCVAMHNFMREALVGR